MRYEYKVIPAPDKGARAKGANSAEGRFAVMVQQVMNDMGARGWEYQRSETLPSTERSGLTQTTIVWRNLLIFRRPHAEDLSAFAPRLLEPPTPVVTPSPPVPEPDPDTPVTDRLYRDVVTDTPEAETADIPASRPVNGTAAKAARSAGTALPGPLKSRAAKLRSRRSQ